VINRQIQQSVPLHVYTHHHVSSCLMLLHHLSHFSSWGIMHVAFSLWAPMVTCSTCLTSKGRYLSLSLSSKVRDSRGIVSAGLRLCRLEKLVQPWLFALHYQIALW
jgi:hypothetical protein